ncbi:MAG: VanZ family protein, partial [Lachnospiraceae bacterium]|nr:VanZ family protein [Lachnospiraceae bacterium]
MNITIKRLESIRRVLLCFIVITVGFIWIHSMMSREVSAEESGRFVELLEPIFRRMNIGDALADHIVRKWAHFLEYAGLGGEMGILACLNRMILRLKSTN